MIDLNLLKTDPEKVKKACQDKNVGIDILAIIKKLDEKNELQIKIESLRQQRNLIAEEVKKSGKPTQDQIEAGRGLKEKLEPLEKHFDKLVSELTSLLEKIPNLPSVDTPVGKDESANKVLRKWGEPTKFDFQPKEHWELGEALGVIDGETAAKVSGTRFNYIKGKLVLLELALIQYAFSALTNKAIIEEIIKKNDLDLIAKPFIPVVPPVFIRPDVFQKMARLEPKEERYYIPSDDLYLIGSAEHTLGPMHMDQILKEHELPIRYVGFSTSFRREAGSYGKDTKGIFRNHQFDKVEIESFSLPETSIKEQNLFVAIQEHLMESLGLPYQVIITSTGDQGDPDARHIDIEAWMPGQNRYRETHSADLMTDYQARRLNTRVKRANNEIQYVHTNDATALALSRTPVAIMENYQRADGSIAVPKVLVPYTGFTEITKE